jgi:integrase
MKIGQKKIFVYPKSQSLDSVWFVKYVPAGTNKPLKIQIPNLDSAEKRLSFANQIIIDIQTNGYTSSHNKAFVPTLKIMELLNEVLNSKKTRISKKSFSDFKTHLIHFQDYTEIHQNQDAEAFLNWLASEKKLNPSTINGARSTLKSLYKPLVTTKKVLANPFDATTKMPEHRMGAKWYKPHQQKLLKKTIQEQEPCLWLPVQYLYYCFIRRNEMRRLQVSDVDLFEGTINIPAHKSKNRKNQFVTIPEPLLMQMIDLKIGDYPSDFYLIGLDGLPSEKQIGENYLTLKHKRITELLNLPKYYSFYSWKHTGAVMFYKNNPGKLRELQVQLRHHSLEMVQIYLESLGISDMPELKTGFPTL